MPESEHGWYPDATVIPRAVLPGLESSSAHPRAGFHFLPARAATTLDRSSWLFPYTRTGKGSFDSAPVPSGLPDHGETLMSCSDAQRRARSLHVYNGRFALTAEPLHPDTHASTYRLNLEIAAARSDGGAGFNWTVGAKISVHLAPRELSDAFAVLNGWRERVESTNRGANRNKGYRMFVDSGHVIVQIFVPQGRRTVKLEPFDRFAVSSLVLELLAAEARGPGIDTVFQQLRAAYEQPESLIASREVKSAVNVLSK